MLHASMRPRGGGALPSHLSLLVGSEQISLAYDQYGRWGWHRLFSNPLDLHLAVPALP